MGRQAAGSPGEHHQETMMSSAWCQPQFAQQQTTACGLPLPCPYIVSTHHYLIKQNQLVVASCSFRLLDADDDDVVAAAAADTADHVDDDDDEGQQRRRRRSSAGVHEAAAAAADAIEGAKPGDQPREAGVAKRQQLGAAAAASAASSSAAAAAAQRGVLGVQRTNATKVLVR
uniref:Expressed protein n=1 Tax=Oryza sativa subsp. japonica TaxID=39947 RepID=Q75LF7_ORYSJ|nr:expressed protein [Oryza sativa Japonica Group]